MSVDLKHSISELLRENRSFNKNDILVNASRENSALFFTESLGKMPRASFPSRILKEARKTNKESGVNPLCSASGFLVSEEGSRKSPIILVPVKFSEDRVRSEITLSEKEDEQFINPYIEFLLREKDVDTSALELENVFNFLQEKGFEIEVPNDKCVGNFHHHRYSVLRELDELLLANSFSGPLRSVFGEKIEATEIELPKNKLFSADVDHEKVFELISRESTVVQGPPGTGKSQVLSNLIGKLLGAKKSALVLSEKRVALEVIQQKLNEFGLDRLGYVATSDNEVHDFLNALEENWHFFENLEHTNPVDIRLSEQYENQLQFTLDVLNQPEAVGGISLYDFKKWMPDTKNALFVNNPPTVPEFETHKETIQFVFNTELRDALKVLNSKTLKRQDFETLLPELETWIDTLETIEKHVPFNSWEEFTYLIRLAGWCQILENARSKDQLALFKPNSRAQKKFLKCYKSYKQISQELKDAPEHPHWISPLGLEDITYLKKSHENQSFLGRRKFRKAWKSYSRLPESEAPNAFKAFDEDYALNAKKSKLLVEFCELNVLHPESELDVLATSIHLFQSDQWEETEKISGKTQAKLTELHGTLNTLYSSLKSTLDLRAETPLISNLRTLKTTFPTLVSNHKKLAQLNNSVLALFNNCESFDSYQSTVAHSHWTLFQQRFPTFSEFNLSDLQQKVQVIIEAEKSEAPIYATTILDAVQQSFAEYHQLLSTPARKLSEDQKALKQRLRKGKSLLVKEFAKTRSHPTMRELFASEAREWIQILKPIWLSNPTQIAKAFPLERKLFDVVIFDEASQIPLQNALGALQRSQHGVIAGDSQQMGPTSYFKTGSSETMDLLHQATFYWENVLLSHHYRSVHPALISFSNQHFYTGNLQAYPAFNAATPLEHHVISEGVFDERRNEVEAKAMAALIAKALKNSDSVGIVAFSEEQLHCIREHIDEDSSQLLSLKIEDGTAFFKAVENVQGDECDHLLVSFGYGRDPFGEFAMRFGPMNTANGRRRLNVLLTRARKRIDWFSSVTSADFKLSDNESIDLLRQWFAYLESSKNQNVLRLPFGLPFEQKDKEISLIEGHKHLSEARELVTFQQVMESRGWTIVYA